MHGNSSRSAKRRLPKRYRGREGAARMVGEVPLRCTVLGVDGAFELTRMAHDALVARRRAVFAQAGLASAAAHGPPIGLGLRLRRRRNGSGTGRLMRQLRGEWPVDAIVLEAPAVGAEGLRFNEDVAQAQTVLLTGIARDPDHGAIAPDPGRARAVAQALPPRTTLVSGESDPALKAALRDAVADAGAFYLDAAPRGPNAPPGLELITVLDRFLRIRVGEGLTPAEKVRLLSRMERRLQWSPSALAGVRWHDGTSVAPAFLRSALDHLLHRWPARVHLVAYFGADKAQDAQRLVPVLDRAFADGAVARAYVAGAGSRPLVRALGSSHPVSVFGATTASLPGLVRILRSESHAGAIVTAGEGGAPWMRAAVDRLRLPGLPRGAWAPFGAPASDLPAPIAVKPPVAAPGIGRRARANILGDPDPQREARIGGGTGGPGRRDRGWVAPSAG